MKLSCLFLSGPVCTGVTVIIGKIISTLKEIKNLPVIPEEYSDLAELR